MADFHFGGSPSPQPRARALPPISAHFGRNILWLIAMHEACGLTGPARAYITRSRATSSEFPQFGMTLFARRFPRTVDGIELQFGGDLTAPSEVSREIEVLPRIEQVSDLHCVTTWNCGSLRGTGSRFRDLMNPIVRPRPSPNRVSRRSPGRWQQI